MVIIFELQYKMQLVLSRDVRYLEIIIRITDFITGYYKSLPSGTVKSHLRVNHVTEIM